MDLKTATDLCCILDIKRPNCSKFMIDNLDVTVVDKNGKAKKLVDIDLPKNKKAIEDYLALNRDGVMYRGEIFSKGTTKLAPVKAVDSKEKEKID